MRALRLFMLRDTYSIPSRLPCFFLHCCPASISSFISRKPDMLRCCNELQTQGCEASTRPSWHEANRDLPILQAQSKSEHDAEPLSGQGLLGQQAHLLFYGHHFPIAPIRHQAEDSQSCDVRLLLQISATGQHALSRPPVPEHARRNSAAPGHHATGYMP